MDQYAVELYKHYTEMSRIIKLGGLSGDITHKRIQLFCSVGELEAKDIMQILISNGLVKEVVTYEVVNKHTEYNLNPQVANKSESPLYKHQEEALDAIRNNEGRASVSLLQRRLHIGYNSAYNLIETLTELDYLEKTDHPTLGYWKIKE